MNDIMAKAYHTHMIRGTLFEQAGWRNLRPASRLDILNAAIKESVAESPGQRREDLWTQVLLKLVPEHFMQFTQSDYKQEVQKMVETRILACPTPRKTKRLNDDCRLYLPS
jgi:hypothetical protein